jgi:hypothetical protein
VVVLWNPERFKSAHDTAPRVPIVALTVNARTEPSRRAGLAGAWGITDRLRQVVLREKATMGRRLPKYHAVIGYGFFADGETPHAAVENLAKRWPALRFLLVPRPAD